MFIQRHYILIRITPVFSKSVYLSLFSYFVFLVSLTDPALASSLCLFSSLSPQILNFLTFKVLFCYSRTESRISIWRYNSFAIRHLCFFQLRFPADRTYFHTSRSVRPLALVVSSVCVNCTTTSLPGPVQVKPQPFYHRPILCFAPLVPLDNILFPPSQQQRPCIKQHAVKMLDTG